MPSGGLYNLGPMIARGGMAEVYLGASIGAVRRLFAIKRILPHYAQESEFLSMFRDEANITSRLQHANIVQVFDFTEINGAVAMVMEFVDGADLRAVLAACEKNKARIQVPHALYIAREVAKGLHYAHARADDQTGRKLNLIHRDISPQNVIISFHGEVKIIDFGVADISAGKVNETKPGIVKGKYSYMSPEQLTASPLDGRSDVFSLAVVLWEMLAMRRLFSGDSDVETIRKVQECKLPAPLHTLNPAVDKELEAVITKALHPDITQRFQNAAEFEAIISAYLHSQYPNFNTFELGSFVGNNLPAKRNELQAAVRKTLTPQKMVATSVPKSMATTSQVSMPRTGTGGPMSSGLPIPSQFSREKSSSGNNRGSNSRSVPAFREAAAVNSKTGSSYSNRQNSAAPRSSSIRRTSVQQRTSIARYRSSNNPIIRLWKWLSPMSRFVLFASFVLLFCIGALWYIRPGVATLPVQRLTVDTQPNSAMISIDGVPKFDGGYVRTPAIVRIQPGKHTVSLTREGYRPIQVIVQAEAGENVKVKNMKFFKLPDAKFIPMRIEAGEGETGSMRFVLDGGRNWGMLPIDIPDVFVGREHVAEITSIGGDTVKCNIPILEFGKKRVIIRARPNASEKRCTIAYE
jgi:serine/threonine protein kinase